MPFNKPFENPYEGQNFSGFNSVSLGDMMTTGNVPNQNMANVSTLGNRGSEPAFFLPSVKSWNEKIKKTQDTIFVKDHTATSYPLQQQNVQNYSHSLSNELQSSSKDTATFASKLQRNDNASASFKKAVDMASRTRDMLNKLDGWKALSLKLPNDFKAQATSPKTCMIKSSSQYTTLDAKSEDAKNILQNIREMAHLLCPSGGISHFSKTSIQDVDTNKVDDKNSNGAYFNGSKSSECFTGPSEYQQYNRGLSGLGSRINLIGSEGMPVNLNTSNILKPLIQRNDANENLSSNMENLQGPELLGREPNYGKDYDRFKSLLDVAVVRTKLNQPSPSGHNWQQEESFKNDGRTVSWNKHSDNLYEDFDGDNTTNLYKMAERSGSAEPLVMYPGTFPELQNASLFQNTLSKLNELSSYLDISKKKDQKDWEAETQNFLKKLQGKKSETKVDQDQGTWRSLTSKSESKGKDKYVIPSDKSSTRDRNRSPIKSNYSSRLKMKYSILSQKRNSKERNRPYVSSDHRRSSIKHGSRDRNRIHREDRSPRTRQRDVLPKSENHDGKNGKKNEVKDEKRAASSKISSDKNERDKTPSVSEVKYHDDHKHSCKECNVSGLSVLSFIDHLLTPGHIEKISKSLPEALQMVEFDVTSLEKNSKDKKSFPIIGTHLLHPVTTGFYCQPCFQYFPHKNALLIHLTTRKHESETSSFNKRLSQKRPSSAHALAPSSKKAKSNEQSQSKVLPKVSLSDTRKSSVTPSERNSVTSSLKNSKTPVQENSVTPSSKNSDTSSQKKSDTLSSKNSGTSLSKNSGTSLSKNAVTPSQKNSDILPQKNSATPSSKNSATPSSRNSETSSQKNSGTSSSKNSVTPSQKDSETSSQKNSGTSTSKNSGTSSSKNSGTSSSKSSVTPSKKSYATPTSKNSETLIRENSVILIQDDEPTVKTKVSYLHKTENQQIIEINDDGNDTDEYPLQALVIDETVSDASNNGIPDHENSFGGAEKDSKSKYNLEGSSSVINTSCEEESNVIKNTNDGHELKIILSRTDSKTSVNKSLENSDPGDRATTSPVRETKTTDLKEKIFETLSNVSDPKEMRSENFISVVIDDISPISQTCDVNEDSGNEDNLIELDGWDEDGC